MPRAPRRPAGGDRPEWTFTVERRGNQPTTSADREAIRAWFSGALVDGWFAAAPELTIDDYEILIIGEVDGSDLDAADEDLLRVAQASRAERFRDDTRDRRIEIATAAEERFGRKVSWGVRIGSSTRHFTTASVPVMTRLHLRQRRTLDTLVEAGIARSRSEALAWCVELVGRNEDEWITRLRSAMDAVAQAREEGPSSER